MEGVQGPRLNSMMQGCTPLLNYKPHSLFFCTFNWNLGGRPSTEQVPGALYYHVPLLGRKNYVISGTNGRDEVGGRTLTLLSSWGVCQASGLRVPLHMRLGTLLPATIKTARQINTSPLTWFNYHKTSFNVIITHQPKEGGGLWRVYRARG